MIRPEQLTYPSFSPRGIPAITTLTNSLTGVTTCCTITAEGELPRVFKLDKVRGLEEGKLIRIMPVSTNWARLLVD